MICFVPETKYPKMDEEFFKDVRKTVRHSRMNIAKNHIQHGNTSVFLHSVAVAYYCYKFSLMTGLDFKSDELVRGALLHDYFLYDWHTTQGATKLHGFYHPEAALINAEEDFNLTDCEKEIIERHMFPLTLHPPKHRESVLVCLVDKLCSTYEVFSRHTYKRLRLCLRTNAI